MRFAVIVFILAFFGSAASAVVVEFDQNVPNAATDDDLITVAKRLYVFRSGYNQNKRSSGFFGPFESTDDGPEKRSMAIGRAGMRPGKRAFGLSYRGKRNQVLPENFFSLQRYFYVEE
uniref:Uncharacterized protein n=1 Tax=Caenorhabditis japonica TaxID=281687 RepID=A0A8R1EC78_CAEJA